MRFIRKLTIAQRFLASVCLFSLPMGVLFFFNMDQLSEKIEFARGEIAGNSFQRPAVRLVKSLTGYQAALASKRDTAGLTQQIDDLIGKMQAENRQSAARLRFTDSALAADGLSNIAVGAIAAEWKNIEQDSGGPWSDKLSGRFDQLVSDVRALIGHAGDTSNLTLDPEMDSYYMSDVTSVTAAQTLNRIGSAEAALEPSFTKRGLNPASRTQASVLGATLKESDRDRISGDLDTALKENAKARRGAVPGLKARIEPVENTYNEDTKALISILDSAGEGKAIDAAEFHQAATRASEAAANLWEEASADLDTMLEMRIAGFAAYRTRLLAGTLAALIVALVCLFLTIRSITVPLSSAIAYAGYIAEGDLSREVSAGYLERGDEIGILSRAMQLMSVRLRETVGDISGGVKVLTSAVSLLRKGSAEMASGAHTASGEAHAVAAAAEQMSTNVVCVAAGMEQTTTNLTNVATAAEEMSANTGTLASDSERARQVIGQANDQTHRITGQIARLRDSAREIDKVTEAINSISSQTQLLALNASIEAARAGAAGKGFAVVAMEIKALASQSAAASEDIRGRIGAVQSATAECIAVVEKISAVIAEISGIVGSIASGVDRQADTTRDIARNIAEASIGVNDANHRVAESSQVSRSIATDIAKVDNAASEMAAGSGRVRASAEDVSRITGQLTLTVERFRV